MGSGDTAPRILNLGTRWRWLVSFTPWPFYPVVFIYWVLCYEDKSKSKGNFKKAHNSKYTEAKLTLLSNLIPLGFHAPVAAFHTFFACVLTSFAPFQFLERIVTADEIWLHHYEPESKAQSVAWTGREADHSPPPSSKVKNAWSYTSTPQYAVMS
jgi:hypothetical protein